MIGELPRLVGGRLKLSLPHVLRFLMLSMARMFLSVRGLLPKAVLSRG